MRAGDLRHRVAIQRKTGGTDSWGTPLPEAWATFAEVWANLLHLSGSESIRADADTSIVKASCRIRWRDDVTAGDRVTHASKTYDIEAVLPGPDRVHVDLLLKLTNAVAAPADPEPPYDGGWG